MIITKILTLSVTNLAVLSITLPVLSTTLRVVESTFLVVSLTTLPTLSTALSTSLNTDKSCASGIPSKELK